MKKKKKFSKKIVTEIKAEKLNNFNIVKQKSDFKAFNTTITKKYNTKVIKNVSCVVGL